MDAAVTADALCVAAAAPPPTPTQLHKVDDGADAEMLQPATPTLAVSPPAPVDAIDGFEAVADALDQLRVTTDASQSPDDPLLLESLVSLPSPVAQPAPLFDVFATSPLKAQPLTSAASPERPTPEHEATAADPLAHSMSELNLRSDAPADASVDAESVAADTTGESVAEIASSQEVDDAVVSVPMSPSEDAGARGELEAVEIRNDAPQPPELLEKLQQPEPQPLALVSQPPGALTEDAATLADADERDEAAESTGDQSAPAALAIPFAFDDTAPTSESPTKSDYYEDDFETLHDASESDGIKSVKKRLSSSELEAASNRLYSDAVESKKRKEVLKAELEETFTFAPQVNAKRRSSIPDEKNRFVALHEKTKEALKRKEELRQNREKGECTFKPKITAKARKLSATAKSTKPRFENLYQQAQEIQLKRDVKKSESEQKAVEECSFKPKIKTMKSPTKSRPLYDAERLKQRKLALEQKKIETELRQCTFKPKVVAKAAKVKGDEAGGGGKTGGDVKLFDRLYQASQKKAENLEKLRHEREEQEKRVATFHPKITAAAAAKAESKQPFHERLYNKDHMQKVTAEREQKKLEEEQKYSFKPQLTPVPDEIKSKHSSPSSSPDKSIFERLYDEKDKVKDKVEAGDMIRKQKELDGCTFHPNIETSPNRAKDPPSVPIWERLQSYDKSQVLEEREKQRHQLEMQECTFKPEVTPSEFFTPKKSPSVGIFDRLTGSAVSMPSSDMKRRESERKAVSVAHSKRRSVPELEGFKNRQQAVSIGAILRSSNMVASPGTSPNYDANQLQSLPASLRSGEFKKLQPPTHDLAAALTAAETCSALESENAMSSSAPTGELELSSPDSTSRGVENNPSEPIIAKDSEDRENYESWLPSPEKKVTQIS